MRHSGSGRAASGRSRSALARVARLLVAALTAAALTAGLSGCYQRDRNGDTERSAVYSTPGLTTIDPSSAPPDAVRVTVSPYPSATVSENAGDDQTSSSG
jgi:hypothetical protein